MSSNTDSIRRAIYDFIVAHPNLYSDEGILLSLEGLARVRNSPSAAGTWRRARIELVEQRVVVCGTRKATNISRRLAWTWQATDRAYPDPWPSKTRAPKPKAPQVLYNALDGIIKIMVDSGKMPPRRADMLLGWVRDQLDRGKGPDFGKRK